MTLWLTLSREHVRVMPSTRQLVVWAAPEGQRTTWVDPSGVPADHPNRDLAVAVLVEYRLGVIDGPTAMDELRRYLL